MITSAEYVLPIGKPDDLGHFSTLSWTEFLRWIFALADCVIVWSQSSRATVACWIGLCEEEIVEFPHPDPACGLNGYRAKCSVIDWGAFALTPASEEYGVAYFAWEHDDTVLARVDVDDFENFAVLNVSRSDAVRLARACEPDLWPRERFDEYKSEIDDLVDKGRWIALPEVLKGEDEGTFRAPG